MFWERASRSQLLWLGEIAVLLSAILIVGRLAWESSLDSTNSEQISAKPVSQSSQQRDTRPQNNGADNGSSSRDQTDQRVQQLQEQYGDVRCTDFENQQEAQEVFELDQILFGDELDSDVNGIACDEENYFSNREPADSLLQAGGPGSGPLPVMLNGSCPAEYPRQVSGACYTP